MLRNKLIFIVLLFIAQTGNTLLGQNSSKPAGSGSLCVGAYAGPSLLVEKAPDSIDQQIQDFINNLRSGWHYGLETEYFINKYIGFGARYIRFNTKQQADSIVVKFFSTILYFDISNDMIIHTLSPMVLGRLPLFDNRLSVTGSIGPAWLIYRNIGKLVGDTAMFKGSSPGLSTSLLIGYNVIPHLNIAFQTNYVHAFLKEITQDNGTTQEVVKFEKKDYQNISRLDFSFGIFFTISPKSKKLHD